MNDRVSNEPPSAFLGEDTAMEGYFIEGSRDEALTRSLMKPLPPLDSGHVKSGSGPSTIPPSTDKEVARRSGIFRFGKSLAAVFNPANIWDDLTHKWKRGGDHPPPQTDLMRERREKAERTYAEMKKNGQLAALSTASQMHDGIRTSRLLNQATKTIPSDRDRDSGIDLESQRSSIEQRSKNGPSSAVTDELAPPPPIKDPVRAPSPGVEAKSGRRGSFNFRKPSISNLKKAKSELHLAKPKSRTTLRPLQPAAVDDAAPSEPAQVLRTQISRKDLQRQQRLSKRVSDLESKLEVARRQLDEIKGETSHHDQPYKPVVHKRSFVPGALATLPSEGMLFAGDQGGNEPSREGLNVTRAEGHGQSGTSARTQKSIHDAGIIVRSLNRRHRGVSEQPMQAEQGLTTPRKRKSSGGITDDLTCYKSDTGVDDKVEKLTVTGRQYGSVKRSRRENNSKTDSCGLTGDHHTVVHVESERKAARDDSQPDSTSPTKFFCEASPQPQGGCTTPVSATTTTAYLTVPWNTPSSSLYEQSTTTTPIITTTTANTTTTTTTSATPEQDDDTLPPLPNLSKSSNNSVGAPPSPSKLLPTGTISVRESSAMVVSSLDDDDEKENRRLDDNNNNDDDDDFEWPDDVF